MAQHIPQSTDELLRRWHRRLRVSQTAHYEAAKPLSRANYILGVPVALLSALVGTSVFATLEASPDTRVKIAIGAASLLAATLSGLQTFLRFDERAEKHRTVAARCGKLVRQIEQIIATSSSSSSEVSEEILTSLREAYDKITEDAPKTSSKMYQRAHKILQIQIEEADESEA